MLRNPYCDCRVEWGVNQALILRPVVPKTAPAAQIRLLDDPGTTLVARSGMVPRAGVHPRTLFGRQIYQRWQDKNEHSIGGLIQSGTSILILVGNRPQRGQERLALKSTVEISSCLARWTLGDFPFVVDETTQLGAHSNAAVLVRASDAAEALAQPSFNTDGFSFSRPHGDSAFRLEICEKLQQRWIVLPSPARSLRVGFENRNAFAKHLIRWWTR